MQLNEPQNFQTEILNGIEGVLGSTTSDGVVSEMTYKERCFLNGIIRQVKPKKILELGVSAGASSAVMLNAIKDDSEAKLYSIDYNTQWYRNHAKPTGHLINEKFSHLKKKWKLYTGATAARFMDEIGGDVDLCLIDTVHANPGEFLDWLIVLPYLKPNAVLVLHDTCFHAVPVNGGGGYTLTGIPTEPCSLV